jgi:hypothetical protein
MKKIKLLLIVFFAINTLFAQNNKYFTRNASITFTSAAAMEKIVSKNSQVNCILNTQTNDLALKVVIKSFEFEKQAMADHFYNDYLQSDKFPNATFEGKITNTIDYAKNGKYDIMVDGKLTIHGVTKPTKQKAIIEIKDGKITTKSSFSIQLSDFGITVPNDYLKKISNTVELKIDAVMTPYVR